MAGQAKEIKNRLKSIKNTKKTTKAMELVSAAKMRKSVGTAIQTRSYEHLAWDIVKRLRSGAQLHADHPMHRFFTDPVAPEGEKIRTTLLVMTSNRGLCGAFNTNVIKLVLGYMKKHTEEAVELIGMGKKGIGSCTALGLAIELAYEKNDTATNEKAILDVARYLHQKFQENKTDKVLVAFTDYQSAIAQTAVIKQLYPLPITEGIGRLIEDVGQPVETLARAPKELQYIYEPAKEAVLQYLVPRIAEVHIYQALLESNASEHSARMLAMKNASDAAREMADELTLAFNRARQASITQEIAEISAGTAALT